MLHLVWQDRAWEGATTVQPLTAIEANIHCISRKTRHLSFDHICGFFQGNLPYNHDKECHLTSTMLLHYLVKLEK